jgi:hypothetical protein
MLGLGAPSTKRAPGLAYRSALCPVTTSTFLPRRLQSQGERGSVGWPSCSARRSWALAWPDEAILCCELARGGDIREAFQVPGCDEASERGDRSDLLRKVVQAYASDAHQFFEESITIAPSAAVALSERAQESGESIRAQKRLSGRVAHCIADDAEISASTLIPSRDLMLGF